MGVDTTLPLPHLGGGPPADPSSGLRPRRPASHPGPVSAGTAASDLDGATGDLGVRRLIGSDLAQRYLHARTQPMHPPPTRLGAPHPTVTPKRRCGQ